MLLSFKVKNFRSIKDEVILSMQATSDKMMKEHATFENERSSFLKLTAIFGPNASGKSNLLRAFAAFRIMVLESLLRSNTTTELPNEFFKLSSETENAPSLFEMTFSLDEEVLIYGFEINKSRICSEWLKKEKGNVMLFERKEQEIKPSKNYFKEATKALSEQTTERTLFLSVLASYKGKVSSRIVEFVKNINIIAGDGNITLDYTFEKFREDSAMAQKMKDFMIMADFGIVDIRADEEMISIEEISNMPDKFKEMLFKDNTKIPARNIKFLHKKYDSDGLRIEDEPLNFFNEESDGTQHAFALSAPLFDTLENGKILLVDEIDSSLHPILCQYLTSLYNSKRGNPNNAQLIFTTHDVSLLDADLLRRDQIYFADKNDKGATELFSLADISEKKGVNYAKRYLEGRYNALPYIADFEELKFSK